MQSYCRSLNFACISSKSRIVDGSGGLVGIVRKKMSFTNTTAKTLTDILIGRTRKIQTLTLGVNSKDFNLANVYIPPDGFYP